MAAAAHTPFEASHRIFVLERADVMNDEAANALLKTLEEPPSYVVLVLLTDRLTQVLPTIASRCQAVRFDPPGPGSSPTDSSRRASPPQSAEAAARLSLGDAHKAIALALGDGPALRAAAENLARSPIKGTTGLQRPWKAVLDRARQRGQTAKEEVEQALREELQYLPKKEHKRRETEFTERARTGGSPRDDAGAGPRAPAHRPLVSRPRRASRRVRPSWRSTATDATNSTRTRVAIPRRCAGRRSSWTTRARG